MVMGFDLLRPSAGKINWVDTRQCSHAVTSVLIRSRFAWSVGEYDSVRWILLGSKRHLSKVTGILISKCLLELSGNFYVYKLFTQKMQSLAIPLKIFKRSFFIKQEQLKTVHNYKYQLKWPGPLIFKTIYLM